MSDRDNQSNIFVYDLADAKITPLMDLIGTGTPRGIMAYAVVKYAKEVKGRIKIDYGAEVCSRYRAIKLG